MDPVTTAQATFASMMKDQVGPGLRALGFKGSGQVFALPVPDHFAQVGFQRSTFSDASAVRFTVNASVIPHRMWSEARVEKPYLPAKPSASILYGSLFWQKRIGELLPAGEDKWWLLHAGQDATVVGDEVLVAIRDFVLPAMRDQIAST